MHDSAEDQRGYDVQAGGAFKKHRAGGRSKGERSAGTDAIFLQKPQCSTNISHPRSSTPLSTSHTVNERRSNSVALFTNDGFHGHAIVFSPDWFQFPSRPQLTEVDVPRSSYSHFNIPPVGFNVFSRCVVMVRGDPVNVSNPEVTPASSSSRSQGRGSGHQQGRH